MSAELQRLAERRQRLVSLVSVQRAMFAREAAAWQPRLAVADRGVAVLRYIRRHPALFAGAGFLAYLLRPRVSSVWLRRGLLLVQVVGSLRGKKSI